MTLEIITSDALAPLRHGFFTRKGGASSGIFHGLNCGYGSSDQHEAVALNRTRVAEALSIDVANLATVHQVHSAYVAEVNAEIPPSDLRADAMVTANPDMALAILTADCQPVLFADPKARVIGAAHAGWKGAKDGVLEATVEAMIRLGAARESIRAVIGPSISRKNYEVGPEFYETFVSEDADTARFFVPGEKGHHYFDLPSYGLSRLVAAGVTAPQWTGHCTYEDPERFYSYRRSVHRNEADYGRLLAAIRL